MIDTDVYSMRLRDRMIDRASQRLLITRLAKSEQEADLSEPVNCDGLGRIRHFRRQTSENWPPNSLPLDPACAALGIPATDELRAQVFQNAGCNWRCWYCYVPFPLLAAAEKHAEWIDSTELVARYAVEPDRPKVLVLSGGQPDLVPEWTLWMVRALKAAGLADSTYLWIDDNLSTDYFWRYLSPGEVDAITASPALGRVGCFKGFDEASFAFTTRADVALFERQFDLFARHLRTGTDCYAYATFTGPEPTAATRGIPAFMDKLQRIHELLPLRTVPLEVALWGPVHSRMDAARRNSLETQRRAVDAWTAELTRRFTADQRAMPVHLVPVGPDG